MSARWLIAFGVLIVAGVAAILMASGSHQNIVAELPAIPADNPPPNDAPDARAPVEDGPVKISTLVLDFGDVPIMFPATEIFHLVNRSGGPLDIRQVSLEGPFRAEPSTGQLNPNTPSDFAVIFDPKKPGVYEQRLRLTVGNDANPSVQDFEVLVRGRAVLSPQAAGVFIPPRPDEAIRRYQQERLTEQLEEAGLAMEGRPQDEDSQTAEGPAGGPDDGATALSTSSDEGLGSPVVSGRSQGSDQIRMSAMAMAVVAFGQEPEETQDQNEVPVSIDGETVPDLPPADGEGDETDSIPPATDDDTGDDEPSADDESPVDKKDEEDDSGAGLMTIAPNSSVTVYSSREALPLQAHRITVSPGGSLVVNGRVLLPELSFAFGQSVSLEQWGHITGTLAPDGTVVLTMMLRVHDPNETFLDLPVQLTTGMAVGYSAAGRMFFTSGVPRDPLTGNVKLVGISNIPLGQGSSLDRAPIYFELLARIQI